MTVAELMEKGQQAVRSARQLLAANDLDGAINRSYYAMFHAARAALLTRGIDTAAKKHGTVLGAFSLHFVKDGPLPKETGRMLNEALQLRTGADYEVARLDREDAERVVGNAEVFLAAVVTHVIKPG